uniref:Beta-catenin HduCTNNB n=1 Tax=Halisarca dujardinii TaxID=2583056 RepID=A0A8F8ARM5_HALDU|nr:beta-catenin HduCTNNB [Halisarca dujardinii]
MPSSSNLFFLKERESDFEQYFLQLKERRQRLFANLQANPYQRNEIEAQIRSVDAEIRSVQLHLTHPQPPMVQHQPYPQQTAQQPGPVYGQGGGGYTSGGHNSPRDSGPGFPGIPPASVPEGEMEPLHQQEWADQQNHGKGPELHNTTRNRVEAAMFDPVSPTGEPTPTQVAPGQPTNLSRLTGPSQMVTSTIKKLIDYQDNAELVAHSLPQLTQLLSDSDPAVLVQAAQVAHQLTKKDASRHAIVNNPSVVTALVRVVANCNESEVQRSTAGALHSISSDKSGIKAIYQCGGIPYLVQLLSSHVEAVVFYAITTLHNLLLHHEPSRVEVRMAGGIEKMVALLTRNNVKFLAVVTDCLQLLAFRDQESKLLILHAQGPMYLVRLMRLHSYEKLLFTCIRILKVLSSCPHNKPEILKAGGMQVLAMHLRHRSSRLVLQILITLRNLSDIGNRVDNLDELLKSLLDLLTSNDMTTLSYVLGILSNLTCNNSRNKSVVTQLRGADAILRILANVKEGDSVVEPSICTLRHLTSRHPHAELAQVAIRNSYGIPVLVSYLQPQFKWSLIKAVVGVVHNLALTPSNYSSLRDEGCLPKLVMLMNKALQDLDNRTVQGGPPGLVDGVYMEEILQGAVGALHVMAADPTNRAIIYSLNCTPVFVRLLYSQSTTIQLAAVRVLCEMVQYHEAAADLEKENAGPRLAELRNSSNDTIAAYCQAIMSTLAGERIFQSDLSPALFGNETLFDLGFPLDEPTRFASTGSTPARSNPASELTSPIGTPMHPHQFPHNHYSMPPSCVSSMPPSAPHSLPPSLPPSNPPSMPGSGTHTPAHPYLPSIHQFGPPEMDAPIDPLDYPPPHSGMMYPQGPPQMQTQGPPMQQGQGPVPNQHRGGMGPGGGMPPQQSMTVHHHPGSYNPPLPAHSVGGPGQPGAYVPSNQPVHPHQQPQLRSFHPPSPAVHDMSPVGGGNPRWFDGTGMDM